MNAHTTRSHAKLSPSAAHRWWNCPGSIRECAGIEQTSSIYADEGAAAHTLAERCLRERVDADEFIGQWVNLRSGKVSDDHSSDHGLYIEITEEMVEAVQIYADVVREIKHIQGVECEIEAKLDLRSVPGMEFGTGDFCAYSPADLTLDVIDFKYGKGVAVEVKENPQLLSYAIGTAKRYHNRGLKKVRLTVVQPRAPHPDGAIRTYECDAVDLMDFESELSAAAERTAEPDAPLKPGEWCKFCPAAAQCPALQSFALDAAREAFAEQPVAVEALSSERLGEIYQVAQRLKDFVKRVEEHAHHEARHGRVPPGTKLVMKRANRKWKDEAEAQEFLLLLGYEEDDIVEKNLISPATADRMLKKQKAAIEPYVTRESSGTTLVVLSDPRPAAKVDASVFADEGAES
jgi:hypothetical protein